MTQFPLIEEALRSNPHCGGGLLVSSRVFHTPRGPYGGQELLTLIYAGDPSEKYWYGHVLRHPRAGGYAAALVWTDKLVNADAVDLLFRRFRYWISIRLCYEPCTVQEDGDAYFHGPSFGAAVAGLATIIRRFSVVARWPDGEDDSGAARIEHRLLDLYGMEDHRDRNGLYPPIPTAEQPSLMIVGGKDFDPSS